MWCSVRAGPRVTLPRVGEAAALAIETQVREDAIRLFGFTSTASATGSASRKLVGRASAPRWRSPSSEFLSPGELATALGTQDKAMVARAPGVGLKLAARIVAELKDKALVFGHVDPAVARLSGTDEAANTPKPIQDAISALVNLGYGRPQGSRRCRRQRQGLGRRG